MQLESKTGFITGGTSGIGLATAKAFIRRGARVAVTGRDRDRVDTAVFLLGPSSIGFVADAGNDQAMKRAIEQTAQPSGGIDILFANAGHYVHSTIGHTSRAALEDQFTVITNTFMTVQHALPFLRERASIVLMGSVYATMGPPGAGAYAASKAAISAMARSLASELSPRGIRVNVVVPGAVDSPSWGMVEMDVEERQERKRKLGERAPLNRMVSAEEVANAVTFLGSDDSFGIHASEIVVDNGTTGAMAGSPRYMRGEPL
ncbi:MAG: SDR family oxidoreductase [Mesorhizobium sp.]|nr:SDR family oxidoreductase [Mesorhizobium sp.]